MRVLSWNVAGRKTQLAQQLRRVLDEGPDVVALQEVSTATYPLWRQGLVEAGYSVLATLDLVAVPYPSPPYNFSVHVGRPITRTKFNATASRLPIAQLAGLSFPDEEEARFAFPEKYLAAEVFYQGTPIEIHNAHAPPGSSRGVVKPQAFRAMRRRVDQRHGVPQILCGDFNTPVSEDDDDVVTASVFHPRLANEWDTAERGILCHPRLADAYREVREPGAPFPVSHRTRTRDCRYDHIYITDAFSVTSCRYLLSCLEERLSDHAPVIADLSMSNERHVGARPYR